jgi:DNA polymerase (family 10)
MLVHNEDIARTFDQMADVLELQQANPFRIRAYRTAARTVRGLPTEIGDLLRQGKDLDELPGIGADLAGKIREIVETGQLAALAQVQKGVPPLALQLCNLPGVGPKRAMLLCRELHIQTLDQLKRAASQGKVRAVRGFGPTIEKKLLASLDTTPAEPSRFLIATAVPYAEALVAHLTRAPGVSNVVVAGSFRRGRETVGDLDIVVTATRGRPVIDWFTRADEIVEVVAAGPTRATVKLRCGLQVDLRVIPEKSYGAALAYLTGSKAHNIAIRRLGQERGLKINEYGVFRGRKRIAGATEESVYEAVHLPYIPPELRELRGEIEAARTGRLPRLINPDALCGDLHTHTRETDGSDTLADMAAAAKRAGLRYIAVTDHSQRVTVAHGLNVERLLRQGEQIDRLNDGNPGIAVLKGIEVDILEDGRLDLPEKVLATLDVAIGAIHSRFDLSREKQTERILRAMDRPHFSILAHPTGRLIGARAGYDIDMARIIRAARERGCFLELNAQPDRLDLADIWCQMAKAEGVLISIGSDAHRTTDFGYLRFGVMQARRGWLEARDVLNTRSLGELRPLLRRTMARAPTDIRPRTAARKQNQPSTSPSAR